MKGFKGSMIVGAAVAGLFAGTAALQAAETLAPAGQTAGPSMAGATGTAITPLAGVKAQNLDAAAAKHDCKGKNDCKGQGGCASGDNGCKAKNSCHGHGGCNTNIPTTAPKL